MDMDELNHVPGLVIKRWGEPLLWSPLRASIMVGCKKAEWWDGGERRGKRGEVGYKLTASLDTRTKKIVWETGGPYINGEELNNYTNRLRGGLTANSRLNY